MLFLIAAAPSKGACSPASSSSTHVPWEIALLHKAKFTETISAFLWHSASSKDYVDIQEEKRSICSKLLGTMLM